MISEAKKKNLDKIAKLHTDLIGGSSSSMFGGGFVKELYRQIFDDEQAHIWTASEGERIIGFICITDDMNGTFRRIKSRISVKRIISIFFHLLSKPKNLPGFIGRIIFDRKLLAKLDRYPNIISIAVDQNRQKSGHGRGLIQSAEKYFMEKGIRRYFVDTELSNTGAVAFYQSLGFKKFLSGNGNICLVKSI